MQNPISSKAEQERQAREAAALRENLRRRKAQHRARTLAEAAAPPDTIPATTDPQADTPQQG
jgi:hypothetical protein